MNVKLVKMGLHILAHLNEMLLQYPISFGRDLPGCFTMTFSKSRKSNC